MKQISQFTFTVIFFVAILYGILSYFDIEAGELVDWIVGVVSFLWLMIIITVPWNAHFKAKEVLDDAEVSQRKDILVIDSSLEYAKRVAKWSLIAAIALHIVSALGLFLVAFTGVSPVGYFAAGAAALLTFLRPTVRFYEYLQQKLREIKREFRYPREDVRELLTKFEKMSKKVENLDILMSLDEKHKDKSWRQDVIQAMRKIEKYHDENDTKVKQLTQETKTEFDNVRQEAQKHLAKITTDSHILDSVREIAKFLKKI